ncbi:NAD(P)-dependent oxidoreductase [Peptoniphilus sp.]|uniref:NAD(P)-dependent oxidoreductase n=1 Tax=Peptoniphilus sp. TaxID=1971214 RepID=UPI002A80B840|nr:NAD(P)-dependent oxidoreductase [Peptoniphilus sp.]MDY3901956.1 NAD(P)-dependent oxidoreductase [Peptoniphilus sp.]
MKYDIIHFEALGKEADYLEIETNNLIKENILPRDFKSLITPLTVQEYLSENNIELPKIITIKTHSILPDNYINNENKNNVITRSAGYDHLEEYQDKLNIASLREYCVNAVAQTALKFGLCTCGLLNEYVKNTRTFERNKTNSFMEISKDRTVTVYGVGKIGYKVYQYFKAVGFNVQAVDIRSEDLKLQEKYKDFNFISKEDAIVNSDILVNVMNLTKIKNSKFYNVNYFNEDYLRRNKKNFIFINVTRGEIAPESVLLKLYNENKILGLGLDVFSHESELTEDLRNQNKSKDIDVLAVKKIINDAISLKENFYVQAHQGFNSDLAAKSKAHEAIEHLKYWYLNNKNGFKEQLPYY